MSLGDRCERRHRRHTDGAGGRLRRALVGPQQNFVLGGQVLPPALLLGQVFLEMGCCEGEGLPTEAHQVGVLEPGVTEAVLDGRAGPEEEETSSTQRICRLKVAHV